MLNNWSGQGRLARDVEMRYTASNIPVATFTIACDRDYKPANGERETDWIDVVAWNKSAEFVEKYFHKGDMIIVQGRIQTRSYEDKNGNRRKAVEIVGTSFNFGGGKKQDGNGQYNPPDQGNTQYNDNYRGGGYDDFMSIPDDMTEELPFN